MIAPWYPLRKLVFSSLPIYDSVFKFLMEDERIAKTVLATIGNKSLPLPQNNFKNFNSVEL